MFFFIIYFIFQFTTQYISKQLTIFSRKDAKPQSPTHNS